MDLDSARLHGPNPSSTMCRLAAGLPNTFGLHGYSFIARAHAVF